MMTSDELLIEWRSRLINERDCMIGLVQKGRDNEKTKAKLKDRTALIKNIDAVLQHDEGMEQRNVSVIRFHKGNGNT
jgi:hypothetical protein